MQNGIPYGQSKSSEVQYKEQKFTHREYVMEAVL